MLVKGCPRKIADFEDYTAVLLAWNEAYLLSFFLRLSRPDQACPSHVCDKIWLHSPQFWF